MILLNTEDLASLNNDRLTVLLPGHWVFFFSHFNFDSMELPDYRDPRGMYLGRGRILRGLKGSYMRPLLLMAMRGGHREPLSDSEDEDEEYSEYSEGESQLYSPNEPNSLQQLMSAIPINQVLDRFLACFRKAQMRSVVLHFFRGLLFWKNVMGVAALLVMMRVRQQQLSPLPGPSLDVASPQPQPTLRIILDSNLVASSGMATAIAQLLNQLPPVAGANTIPAQHLAELFLSPRCWHRNALHTQPPRGIRFTPGFWLTLCEFFGVRANPEEDSFPDPHQPRYLELHVVGDEDVVLREALQDDLQRYRQCGLHDGLQDTSQDVQDNDVQEEDLLAREEAVTLRPRNLMDPEILDFLNNRLLYILGADGRLTLLSRGEVSRALARFFTMAYRMANRSTARERARLEELSDSDDELD